MSGARDPARRIEEHARALLRRVEIGDQPARRRQFGPRRCAQPIKRGEAEAALERALAGQAVEPALACGCLDPG